MLSQTLLAFGLAATTSAHFILQWPPTAGFLDEQQVDGPCGGATVTVNETSPEVQVDRFAVQIQSSHPHGNWQFRATLDTEEPYNWTNLSMVMTEGVGVFCLNYLSAPGDFAGKGGILQVTDYSGDGTLYQVCLLVMHDIRRLLTFPIVCRSQLRQRRQQHPWRGLLERDIELHRRVVQQYLE